MAHADSRKRHGPSELRDVVVIHQPDAGADRAVDPSRQIPEQVLCAAENARRESGAAASRQDRRQADETFRQAVDLYRHPGRRAVQGGSVSVLSGGASHRHENGRACPGLFCPI